MDHVSPARKDIRIPSTPPDLGKEAIPSFNAVAVRILRRSWIEALHEIQAEQSKLHVEKDKELDFRDIFFLFLKGSWVIALLAAAGFWIGHQRAAKLPNLYSSSALLVPTVPVTASASASTSPDKPPVSPDLAMFGALMQSRTVMMQVLKSPVKASPSAKSLVPYANTLGIDTADGVAMQQTANSLGSSIYLSDEGSGIFRLTFTSTDSFVVPQMADIVLDATQKELVRVKTQRMSSALKVLQTRLQEAEQEYRTASARLATFLLRNVDMESGDLQVRQAQLEADIRMKEQSYTQARDRADLARSELDQAYPPAMVFDPASRPASLIGPNRRNKAMLAAFVGLVIGVALVLGWEFLLKKRPS